jgi:hypothetical protein
MEDHQGKGIIRERGSSGKGDHQGKGIIRERGSERKGDHQGKGIIRERGSSGKGDHQGKRIREETQHPTKYTLAKKMENLFILNSSGSLYSLIVSLSWSFGPFVSLSLCLCSVVFLSLPAFSAVSNVNCRQILIERHWIGKNVTRNIIEYFWQEFSKQTQGNRVGLTPPSLPRSFFLRFAETCASSCRPSCVPPNCTSSGVNVGKLCLSPLAQLRLRLFSCWKASAAFTTSSRSSTLPKNSLSMWCGVTSRLSTRSFFFFSPLHYVPPQQENSVCCHSCLMR